MIPAAVNLIYHKKTNRDSMSSINFNTSENNDLSKHSMKLSQFKYNINNYIILL